jgi:hypothetical protein
MQADFYPFMEGVRAAAKGCKQGVRHHRPLTVRFEGGSATVSKGSKVRDFTAFRGSEGRVIMAMPSVKVVC